MLRFCSRSTSFPSALEVFHDYALYKFTIDIDIEIVIALFTVVHNLMQLLFFSNNLDNMNQFQ